MEFLTKKSLDVRRAGVLRAFVTCPLMALLLSCQSDTTAYGCRSIAIDSAGTYDLRVSTIRHYELMNLYLASHKYVDVLDLEVPNDPKVSAPVDGVTLSGVGSDTSSGMVCKNFPANGEKSVNCWKSVPDRKLMISVQFKRDDLVQIEKDVEAISRYVTRNVICGVGK